MSGTPLTDAIEALTTYSNTVTGASDTTLSEAVATLASGYGGGGGGGIPSSYTQRTYIQSNGDAYIDMGFSEVITWGAVIEAAFDYYTPTHRFGLFGYQGTSITNQRFVLMAESNNSSPIYYAKGSGASTAMSSFVQGQKNTFKVDFTSNLTYPVFTVNNTTSTGDKARTNTLGNGMGNWYLCANNYQGSTTAYDTTVGDDYVRCYGFTLTIFGVKVRDFVPVTRNIDSVAGFWDTVTEAFYPSIGGQAFTYG